MLRSKAVVLFSGGLDSATVLNFAVGNFQEILALSFLYNQKHEIEIDFAKEFLLKNYTLVSGEHVVGSDGCRQTKYMEFAAPKWKSPWKSPIHWKVVSLHGLSDLISGTALVAHESMENQISVRENFPLEKMATSGIPETYVPARNSIFLSLAAAAAESFGAQNIVTGVNAVDYSGYPDCRPEFIKAMQGALSLGTKQGLDYPFVIHTPLINMTKAEIIRYGSYSGVDYKYTWSCYSPKYDPVERKHKHCGVCDSCQIRKEAFKQAGIFDSIEYSDPTEYFTI